MFQQLCGREAFKGVVLASTFWSTIGLKEGVEREYQLRTSRKYWREMVDHGSAVFRQDHEKYSGTRIIEHLIETDHTIVLAIQAELVDDRKILQETAAGVIVSRELDALQSDQEAELSIRERELSLANQQDDTQRIVQLEASVRECQRMLQLQIPLLESISKSYGPVTVADQGSAIL